QLLPAISNVDRILISLLKLLKLCLFYSIACKKFDYCIYFTRNDRSAFLTLLSGARRRIASYRVRDQSKTRARLYTELVGIRVRDRHTIDYNLALLEPLGVHAAPTSPELNLPQTAHENADGLRRDSQITRPYLILHPGSARREKLWEPERWAEVVDGFKNKDFDLVLTSGPSADEQAHVAAITKLTRKQTVDLSGKTDLLTLAAVIARAELLVTVDSAPMHLAAATHTPQVILFGPTNPFHWRPLESPALILHGESASPLTVFSDIRPRLPMRQVSTEAVIGAMDSLLSLQATTR